ncbi:nuclear transport factor 2 family protein [Amycolatopsis sp. K13G38]|uniref:Nuclear transport factor 2 family protein n=1 Tax=Amycolatopsis acididurans TaxID=2724524 RepID=A0ABX1J3C0_9PSEU|nr:nuclear transport factor 2 family protein [Amycolatopsis acididurans]NKQ54276.1 nuclear transport factor 2 family protein [Amycolatopsis acididurans]
MVSDIERLVAVDEIKKLKARYFRFLDAHDWAAFAELFTEDADFDIAESSSGVRSKEDFLAALGAHLTPTVSVHHGHMPEIDVVDERTATGVWAMFDSVEPPAGSPYPVLTGFGHYHEEYRREAGIWRISKLRLTRLKRKTRAA